MPVVGLADKSSILVSASLLLLWLHVRGPFSKATDLGLTPVNPLPTHRLICLLGSLVSLHVNRAAADISAKAGEIAFDFGPFGCL